MSAYSEAMTADTAEIMSYIRALISRSPEDEAGESENERLWHQVYGTIEPSESYEELIQQAGTLIGRKRQAASMVILHAANRIARLEKKSTMDVLTELEQQAIATFEEDDDTPN